MRTVEIYEKKSTKDLQFLLKKFEKLLEENELKIDELTSKKINSKELKKLSDDYEIDISLIRMELNRRLWRGDVQNELKKIK